MARYDFLIVGGGIVGAAIAYRLAPHGRVAILEKEAQPGYHATGRSTATFVESYGGQAAHLLTVASRGFLESPPAGFCDGALLARRGNLRFARPGQREQLAQTLAACGPRIPDLAIISQQDALALCPPLQPELVDCALYEPRAADMDVHAIHQGYLRAARAQGADIYTETPLEHIERRAEGHPGRRQDARHWRIHAKDRVIEARWLINAAGAWADNIARLAGVRPLGITPKRRTVVTFTPPAGGAIDHWPLVRDADESFYFKPFGGDILLTPADETPLAPCDAQPEEIDIAIALARMQAATGIAPSHLASRWAGLRSFPRDERPAIGRAADEPYFFWAAGLGGYGIQTSPAIGFMTAHLLADAPLPTAVEADLTALIPDLAPARFS